MSGAAFIDSNILIYAVSDDPRAAPAQALVAQGCVTSVQGLNEFANVARRKLGMDWTEIQASVESIRTLCRVITPIDVDLHVEATRLADRYGFSFYDALMIASAMRLDCLTFWSEDMQHGMVVDGKLMIQNPFR